MKRPEPKVTVSVRVSPDVRKRVRDFVLDYNTANFKRGFGAYDPVGPPLALTEPLALRWALETGLRALEADLKKKGGSR